MEENLKFVKPIRILTYPKDTSKRRILTRAQKRERLLPLMYTCGEYVDEFSIKLIIPEINNEYVQLTKDEARNLIIKMIKHITGFIRWQVLEDGNILLTNNDKPYLKHAIRRMFLGPEHVRCYRKWIKYMYSDIFIGIINIFHHKEYSLEDAAWYKEWMFRYQEEYEPKNVAEICIKMLNFEEDFSHAEKSKRARLARKRKAQAEAAAALEESEK